MGTFTLHHEEPRRGIVVLEMARSGSLLQPTVLGERYYSKPPLHNWLILPLYPVMEKAPEFVLRFPSVVFTIVTCVLLFWFTGAFFSGELPLLATMVFSTSFMVLFGYASKCEPDALFTLVVFSSVAFWFYLLEKGRHLPAWTLGYFFVSLGLLTKGFPALHFFLLSVLALAVTRRDFRFIFTASHLLGFLAGIAPFLLWLCAVDAGRALSALTAEVLSRSPKAFDWSSLKAYITFPFRFLLAGFPWTFVVLLRLGRHPLPALDRTAKFLLLSCAFNIGVYWLFPGSRLRYTMPVFPLLSVVTALLLEDFGLRFTKARALLKSSVQLSVPAGILACLLATGKPPFVLACTFTFLIFLYPFYFLLTRRLNLKSGVVTVALLMLLSRGFFDAYYLPTAELKYPPVKEVAKEIAELTRGHRLYTKTKYLQLCFYVELERGEILRYTPSPPPGALFLSEAKEGKVLKSFRLGSHTFFLCSFSARSNRGRTSEDDSLKVKSQYPETGVSSGLTSTSTAPFLLAKSGSEEAG
jgi:4-amino-4-deoxy-L-arabinose transferase-like glycosyltransferase